MVTIKESIDLLLKILQSFGFSKLKAEDFRLAKFNEEAISPKMWRLLFETIYYLKYGSIDEVCVRAFNYFTTEEITVYVKRDLQKLGFVSYDLNILLNNMSNGSRELLLAFGWLLCKETVIFRLHSACLAPLESAVENVNDTLEPPTSLVRQYKHPQSDDIQDGLKQMVWLNGKLRVTLKQLHGLQQEQFTLTQQVHEATNGLSLESSNAHLSPFEVHLLKHPSLLKKNLKLLEQDNERIDNLLQWKGHEDEFWHWMESVLDLKIQEADKDGSEFAADSQMSSKDLDNLTAVYKRLHNSLLKYENIAELLETQWSSQTLSVSQSEVELMIAAVDREIDNFIQGASKHSIEATSVVPQHPQFEYKRPECYVISGSVASGKPRQQLPNVSRDIEKEVWRLEAILAKLEVDVENNHTNFTRELQSMSNSTNSMVIFEEAI